MAKKTSDIVLELYDPHEMQLKMHNSTARFRVGSFGRQAGKSTWGTQEILKKAWENRNTSYWFISPIFSQAETQYNRLEQCLVESGALLKTNQSKLKLTLINGSTIEFKSGETFHRLRGDTLDGVIIDEVRDQHPDLWPQIIRPMLLTTGGWAAFISTPKGYDQFYDFFEKGSREKNWESMQAPSTCNPLISEAEIAEAMSTMSFAEYEQEILAQFRDLSTGKAYPCFTPENIKEKSPFVTDGIISPHLPIVLAMDFNLSPMAWTLGQFHKNQIYWYDEIHLNNSHTQEATLELVRRVKGHHEGLILVGDATGKATQRTSNKSDYDIVMQILDANNILYKNMTPDSNPAIKDRVNTMNGALKSADGTMRTFINPACKALIRDFTRTVWKDGSNFILDAGPKRELTHASDGVGYATCVLMPIKSIKGSASISVVRY
jgi:hypothetical protein